MVMELDLATLTCVQGVQYVAEDANLGSSYVQGEGSGGVFAHPDDLCPGSYEVQNPGTQGGVQTQLNQLASQSTWSYGVKSRAKVNKQHSHITFTFTFTFREFGRRFYPKRLTKSTFVEGEAVIYHLKIFTRRLERVS